jgi:hypothetical protein
MGSGGIAPPIGVTTRIRAGGPKSWGPIPGRGITSRTGVAPTQPQVQFVWRNSRKLRRGRAFYTIAKFEKKNPTTYNSE